MHWIITKDHISQRVCETLGDPVTTHADRTFRAGRQWKEQFRSADDAQKADMLATLKAEMNYEFRLYDDDGELYYEGLCKDLDDQSGDDAFEPLDWAMMDSGCTTMKYRKKGETAWQTL